MRERGAGETAMKERGVCRGREVRRESIIEEVVLGGMEEVRSKEKRTKVIG